MKSSLLSLLALTLLGGTSAACSSSDTGSGSEPGTAGGGGSGNTGGAGGVDPTPTDNPCGLHTTFPGDDLCIPPPAENVGFQMHVGPDSYDDPDVIGAVGADGRPVWTMAPGDERTQCFHLKTPNTRDIYYYEQQYRMRPGSHHLIVSVSANANAAPGWGTCDGGITGAIGGTQHSVEDYPAGGVAPEDANLARAVAPATPLDFQLHFFNAGEEPTLREVWVNFLYKEWVEGVTQNLGMLGGFAQVSVAPHTSVQTGSTCKYENALRPSGMTEARVLSLFGHAHAHNTRFAVWKDSAGGTSEVVYDNYDWAESPQFFYNTRVQNPVPDETTRKSGASSGLLTLGPGDQLRFQCDITNDLNTALRGSNEVYTGEMCNLFGSFVGPGFPCFALQ